MATDIRVSAQELQAFTTAVFTKAGLPPADAAIEAEVLVWANLRVSIHMGCCAFPGISVWLIKS